MEIIKHDNSNRKHYETDTAIDSTIQINKLNLKKVPIIKYKNSWFSGKVFLVQIRFLIFQLPPHLLQ